VRAPAKINLSLSVGPLRADGYHSLSTVFCAVSLTDVLTATPAESLAITVDGQDAAGVPTDERNLALRAARALADAAGVEPRVALALHKSVPVAGGMAGGSADAAAALVACDALWGTGLDSAALARIGATLGSDVPFALHGGLALGTGRGEVLTPVLGASATYEWVVALADGGLSTPAVYTELDRQRAAAPVPGLASRPDAVLAALRAGDAGRLGRALANDLQLAAVALRPELSRTLAAGLDLGALGGVVSGSGPTCVFLAGSDRHAAALASGLRAAGVARAVLRARGPVPGPRVLDEPGGS
jgi:4-diphosphocytidyl-2-C-methyl-D-erythritol kinase